MIVNSPGASGCNLTLLKGDLKFDLLHTQVELSVALSVRQSLSPSFSQSVSQLLWLLVADDGQAICIWWIVCCIIKIKILNAGIRA